MIQTNTEIKHIIDENDLITKKLDEFVSKIDLENYKQIDESYSDKLIKIVRNKDELQFLSRFVKFGVNVLKNFYLFINLTNSDRFILIENNKITNIYNNYLNEIIKSFNINEDYKNIEKIISNFINIYVILKNNKFLNISQNGYIATHDIIRKTNNYIYYQYFDNTKYLEILNKFGTSTIFFNKYSKWSLYDNLNLNLTKLKPEIKKLLTYLNTNQYDYQYLDSEMEKINKKYIELRESVN
jgi:hypothetical protein